MALFYEIFIIGEVPWITDESPTAKVVKMPSIPFGLIPSTKQKLG
jgi:hypothetical protein